MVVTTVLVQPVKKIKEQVAAIRRNVERINNFSLPQGNVEGGKRRFFI